MEAYVGLCVLLTLVMLVVLAAVIVFDVALSVFDWFSR